MNALADFTVFSFAHGGKERIVYRRGTGPAVVVMHEIPGITPQVARFARYVADEIDLWVPIVKASGATAE